MFIHETSLAPFSHTHIHPSARYIDFTFKMYPYSDLCPFCHHHRHPRPCPNHFRPGLCNHLPLASSQHKQPLWTFWTIHQIMPLLPQNARAASHVAQCKSHRSHTGPWSLPLLISYSVPASVGYLLFLEHKHTAIPEPVLFFCLKHGSKNNSLAPSTRSQDECISTRRSSLKAQN